MKDKAHSGLDDLRWAEHVTGRWNYHEGGREKIEKVKKVKGRRAAPAEIGIPLNKFDSRSQATRTLL